jgi:hypothetical protein
LIKVSPYMMNQWQVQHDPASTCTQWTLWRKP